MAAAVPLAFLHLLWDPWNAWVQLE